MAGDSISNKSVSVGTRVVQIANEVLPTQRKFISIINTSTGGQIINISINGDASAGIGIQLSPGGSYSDSADGNSAYSYFPPYFSMTAVSNLAGGTLAIAERIGSEVK